MEEAKFVPGHAQPTVEAGGKLYTAPHIVIATGGRPSVPNVPGEYSDLVSGKAVDTCASLCLRALVTISSQSVSLTYVFQTTQITYDKVTRNIECQSAKIVQQTTMQGLLSTTSFLGAAPGFVAHHIFQHPRT